MDTYLFANGIIGPLLATFVIPVIWREKGNSKSHKVILLFIAGLAAFVFNLYVMPSKFDILESITRALLIVAVTFLGGYLFIRFTKKQLDEEDI